MAFGVRVDLMPVAPLEAEGRRRVRVVQVALRKLGKGPSSASRAEQPATLTFHLAGFSTIRDGRPPREAKVGSISGTLAFESKRNSLTFRLPEGAKLELEQPLERVGEGPDPDAPSKKRRAFELRLDPATFPVQLGENLLLLPDAAVEDSRFVELSVELEVAGAIEAGRELNGVLDTPVTSDAPIPIEPKGFKLVIRDHLGRPQPGIDYEIEADREVQKGTTDGDGNTRLHITRSKEGKLRVAGLEYDVTFVAEPGDDISEFQGILNALGFNAGELTGKINRPTEDAIFAFQRREGLSETGQLDETTRQRLLALHDAGDLEQG